MLISPCPCDCSGIGTEGWSRFCLVWKCPWLSLLSQFHLACSKRWKFFWNFDTDCGQSPKWEMKAIIVFKTIFFINQKLLWPMSPFHHSFLQVKWYSEFMLCSDACLLFISRLKICKSDDPFTSLLGLLSASLIIKKTWSGKVVYLQNSWSDPTSQNMSEDFWFIFSLEFGSHPFSQTLDYWAFLPSILPI